MSMVWQTQIVCQGKMDFADPYAWLVFCATLLIYALHRLIGFTVIKQTIDTRRIRIIARFRNHIRVYAAIASVVMIWLGFQIDLKTFLLLGLPTAFSLAYVIPLFRKKRLRDLPFIKVFVVAAMWSLVTTIIPASSHPVSSASLWWLAVEKCFFIVALTLPFDVRDCEIDSHYGVSTFATRFGVKASLLGAIICSLIAIFIVILQTLRGFYESPVAVALIVSYIYVMVLISLTTRSKHDYFFTAGIDGAMLLQWILILLFQGQIMSGT